MAESTVKVVFIGDASKLKKELGEIDDATDKSSKGFSGFGTVAAAGFAAGGAAAVAFGKSAFDAYQDSRKVAKQTDAALASTGATAWTTADAVSGLAESISKKTGVDDEAIQTGQNLLLTFTNLQNRAGDGNDIFDQATKTMVDMAAALGTDASGSAIQLGKALNDPVNGISALTRVGVTFTEEQKAQIKAMQAAGDIAGAQKVILAELSKEFGGSAEAQATATDKMKVAFGNLQEQIGAKLAPVIDALATWIVEVGIPAFERMAGWVQEHWPQISATVSEVMGRVRAVIEEVLGAIEAFWRTWGGTITRFLEGWWAAARQQIEGAMNVIRGVIDLVLGLIQGDWGRVWDGIKKILDGAWTYLNGLVDQAINVLRTIIEVGMRLVAGVFDAAWDAIKSAFGAAWDGLKGLVREGVDWIWDTLSGLPGRIVGLTFAFASAAASLGKGILDGIISGIGGAASGALDFAKAFGNAVIDVLNEQIIDRVNNALEFTIKGPGWLPDIHVNPPDIPHIPKFHSGGIVPGSGETLALLRGGEGVFTRDQMRALGGVGQGMTVNIHIGRATPEDVPVIADRFRRELTVLLRGAVA